MTDLSAVLASVRRLLDEGAYEQASVLVADHAAVLLDHGDGQTLAALMGAFPPQMRNERADLLYVAGLQCQGAGQLEEALNLLERAYYSFLVAHGEVDRAVRVGLAIVHLHFRSDNIRIALHYLQHVIQPLIDDGAVDDLRLHGQFYQFLSEISPDRGMLAESIGYAQQAYNAFRTVKDLHGQFRALTRLASALTQLGDFTEAEAKLSAARAVWNVGNLGEAAQLRLLNALIYFYWYQGKLAEAIAVADEYQTLADQNAQSNFRVYARLLLGNFYRAGGDYAAAARCYDAARVVANEVNFQRYTDWIDVQTAWLRILTGHLDEARLFLYAALHNADLGKAMSFQVGLGVVNLLENHLEVADRLLRESLNFYLNSGDVISVCAIRFFLTLTALQANRGDMALAELSQALATMAEHRISYLPNWWHPQLVTSVCVYALQADLYVDVVERLFLLHLGESGAEALRRQQQADNQDVRAHARRILHLLHGRQVDELAHFSNSPAKRVLTDLLQDGLLRRDGFARLQTELTTAQTRAKPNPTALAVFGLYVNGASRTQIAARVGCTVANVRNYITLIYSYFGLDAGQFTTREARRQALVELARARGFID